MPRPRYHPWMNAALYQSVWFVTVLGREALTLVAIALVASHLAACRQRGGELAVMLACALLGVATDSALALVGLYDFDAVPSVLPIPFWLVVLWLGFTATFRHALRWFLARPVLAALAGALGGPLSYLAAARLGAVTLPFGPVATGLVLAAVWTGLMVAFVGIVRAIGRREAAAR